MGTLGSGWGRDKSRVCKGTTNQTESPERTSGAPELRAGCGWLGRCVDAPGEPAGGEWIAADERDGRDKPASCEITKGGKGGKG